MTRMFITATHLLCVLALMLFAYATPVHAVTHVGADAEHAAVQHDESCGAHRGIDQSGGPGDHQPAEEKPACCAVHCAAHSHVILAIDASVTMAWTESATLMPGGDAFRAGFALDTPKRPPRA